MMSIGDFARASGLTAKALRLYDETGLLEPAEVDEFTGYRWYAAASSTAPGWWRTCGWPGCRSRGSGSWPTCRARAAAAELTSYWRQVEADTATARRLVADLVAALTAKEHDMSITG